MSTSGPKKRRLGGTDNYRRLSDAAPPRVSREQGGQACADWPEYEREMRMSDIMPSKNLELVKASEY